jgi:hypothetical protein
MKKIVLTLGIFLSGISILSVQAKSSILIQTNGTSSRLESIKKNCNLTPDQTSKVQNLLNDYQTTQEANEKANKGNPDGLKEAQKKNSYDFNQRLAKVLTPEQMKSLNAADLAWGKEHEKNAK